MGFNTVALVLNDLMDEMEKCPRTVAYMLSHPPMDGRRIRAGDFGLSDEGRGLRSIHTRFKEPMIHAQALSIMPTYHADDRHFLMAGRNDLVRLDVDKYGEDKKTGKKWVRIWMPE